MSTVMVLGIGLAVFGWSRVRTDVRLDQRNAVIEGKVIDGFISTGMKSGQWSHLVVEYHPANHAPVRRTFDVDSQTYKSGLETRTSIVTYLPEDPQVSRVTRFSPLPYQILVWVGGLMALVGLIGLIGLLRTRAAAVSGSRSTLPPKDSPDDGTATSIFRSLSDP
jgi:hypothetical protein